MNRYGKFVFALRCLLVLATVATSFGFTNTAEAGERYCQDHPEDPACLAAEPTVTPTDEADPTPTQELEEVASPTPETPTVTATEPVPQVSCNISARQDPETKNRFDFNIAIGDEGVYTVDFGDGNNDSGVTGPNGSTWHDYGYAEGAVARYTARVLGFEGCDTEVVIDDTPEPLPTQIPEVSCSLRLVSQNLNLIEVEAIVMGNGDYPGHLDWNTVLDDQDFVDLPSGVHTLEKGYGYNEGGVINYSVSLTVLGASSPCGLDIIIDNTPLPQPNPSPSEERTSNSQGDSSPQPTPVAFSSCRNPDGPPQLPEQGMLICWHSLNDVEVWSNQPFNIQVGFSGPVLPGLEDESSGLYHIKLQDPTGGKLILWGDEVGVRFRENGSQVFKAFEPVLGP